MELNFLKVMIFNDIIFLIPVPPACMEELRNNNKAEKDAEKNYCMLTTRG